MILIRFVNFDILDLGLLKLITLGQKSYFTFTLFTVLWIMQITFLYSKKHSFVL